MSVTCLYKTQPVRTQALTRSSYRMVTSFREYQYYWTHLECDQTTILIWSAPLTMSEELKRICLKFKQVSVLPSHSSQQLSYKSSAWKHLNRVMSGHVTQQLTGSSYSPGNTNLTMSWTIAVASLAKFDGQFHAWCFCCIVAWSRWWINALSSAQNCCWCCRDGTCCNKCTILI